MFEKYLNRDKFDKVLKFLESKDYEKALKVNETLISKKDSHINALLLKGLILKDMAKYSESIIILEEVISKIPDFDKSNITEFDYLYENGIIPGLKLFAYEMQADCYEKLDNNKKAIDIYKSILDKDPKWKRAEVALNRLNI